MVRRVLEIPVHLPRRAGRSDATATESSSGEADEENGEDSDWDNDHGDWGDGEHEEIP